MSLESFGGPMEGDLEREPSKQVVIRPFKPVEWDRLGFSIPSSMGKSNKSAIRRILACGGQLSWFVARLWARYTNSSRESKVSRALKGALKDSRAELEGASLSIRSSKELILLEMMGMMLNGVATLLHERWYAILPSDSTEFIRARRPHPFGLWANSKEIHIFSDWWDISSNYHAINDIVTHNMSNFKNCKIIMHFIYRGVPPTHAMNLEYGWPLAFMPSIICHWHYTSNFNPRFDRINYYVPSRETEFHLCILNKIKNWNECLSVCKLIDATIADEIRRIPPGKVLNEIESSRRKYRHCKRLKSSKEINSISVSPLRNPIFDNLFKNYELPERLKKTGRPVIPSNPNWVEPDRLACGFDGPDTSSTLGVIDKSKIILPKYQQALDHCENDSGNNSTFPSHHLERASKTERSAIPSNPDWIEPERLAGGFDGPDTSSTLGVEE